MYHVGDDYHSYYNTKHATLCKQSTASSLVLLWLFSVMCFDGFIILRLVLGGKITSIYLNVRVYIYIYIYT